MDQEDDPSKAGGAQKEPSSEGGALDPLATLPAAELVAILEERYQGPLPERMRRLEALARAAEQAHGDDPRFPSGLAGTVEVTAIDLLDHVEKEQRVVFPAVRRGLTIELTPPVRVLRREHEDQLEVLEELRDRTDGYTVPDGVEPGSAPAWHALYRALADFDAGLSEQIHLETEHLFPKLVGAHERPPER